MTVEWTRKLALFIFLGALLHPAKAQDSTAALMGTVSDSAGVLAGVQVVLSTGLIRGEAIDTVETDSTGNFSFSSLSGSNQDIYTLSVSLDGYRDYINPGLRLEAGTTDTVNIVLVAEDTTGADTTGLETATILGSVLADSGTGNPVMGAIVYLSVRGGATGAIVAQAVTNSEGAYRFEDVPTGRGRTYSLTAAASGYQSTSVTGIRPDSGEVDTLNLVLIALPGNSWSVSGTVTADSDSGEGIAGATVEFRSIGGQERRYVATSDSTGAYVVLMPAQGGSFAMVVSAQGYVTSSEMQIVNTDSSVFDVVLMRDTTLSSVAEMHFNYQPRLTYQGQQLLLAVPGTEMPNPIFQLTVYNALGKVVLDHRGSLGSNGIFFLPLKLSSGAYSWRLENSQGIHRGVFTAR